MAESALRVVRLASKQHSAWRRMYATTTQSRSQEPEELPSGFDVNKLSSMAHSELETHRELRHLARLAAWEMPLLYGLGKPFQEPTRATPLRWRYTTYMGELHPAAGKVVVEFCVEDLPNLTRGQQQTLKKLAGVRWDPRTDIIKMSCESFETQAQNKRYLGQTISALIKEAKEGEDKFEDVALDVRHAAARARKHKRVKMRFPKEWLMTSERRAELDGRNELLGRWPPSSQADDFNESNQALEDREQGQAGIEEANGALEAIKQAAEQKDGDQGQVEFEEASQVFEAIKQAAIEAGEIQEQSHVESKASIVSGIQAIEEARNTNVKALEQPVMVEAGRPLPAGKMGKKEMGQQPAQRPW